MKVSFSAAQRRLDLPFISMKHFRLPTLKYRKTISRDGSHGGEAGFQLNIRAEAGQEQLQRDCSANSALSFWRCAGRDLHLCPPSGSLVSWSGTDHAQHLS